MTVLNNRGFSLSIVQEVPFLLSVYLSNGFLGKGPHAASLGSSVFALCSWFALLDWQQEFTWAGSDDYTTLWNSFVCQKQTCYPNLQTSGLQCCLGHCHDARQILAWKTSFLYQKRDTSTNVLNRRYNVVLYFYYFHIYIFIFSENIFIVRVINMFASLEKPFIPLNNAVYIY